MKKGRVFRRKIQAFGRVELEGQIPGGDKSRFAKLLVFRFGDYSGEVVSGKVQELDAVQRREVVRESSIQSVVRDVQVV